MILEVEVVNLSYITKTGETFDSIAKNEMGKEKYARELMEANQKYIEYVFLPAGIELEIPEIDEESSTGEKAPPWRG